MMTNQSARRRLTGRVALTILLIVAPLAWGGFLLFTYHVAPQTVQAFVVFFALLGVALTCTLSPLIYFISLRFLSSRLHRATVRHALRQGALLSFWMVFNLVLRALHSWSIFTAIISFAIIVVIEVLSLGRK